MIIFYNYKYTNDINHNNMMVNIIHNMNINKCDMNMNVIRNGNNYVM